MKTVLLALGLTAFWFLVLIFPLVQAGCINWALGAIFTVVIFCLCLLALCLAKMVGRP